MKKTLQRRCLLDKDFKELRDRIMQISNLPKWTQDKYKAKANNKHMKNHLSGA
jgi:hypothetical protein